MRLVGFAVASTAASIPWFVAVLLVSLAGRGDRGVLFATLVVWWVAAFVMLARLGHVHDHARPVQYRRGS